MIAIIDYGVGNLKSVEKAFHYIGCDAAITSDRDFIMRADAVVLPGVGAFAGAMKNLREAGMDEVVRKAIIDNKPFLGICLGLQLLFDYSEEGGGRIDGLGILKGAVKQLPANNGLKVPHMGWNSINTKKGCRLFEGLPENPFVYFVHSYYLTAEDRGIVSATTGYGFDFDVAIEKGKLCATQFHPEKSGRTGLAILRNFVKGVKQ